MHKVAIGIVASIALLLAGTFVWNAEATPLTGNAILRSAASHSLVEKAACVRQGAFSRCPLGQHWKGGCVPCSESLTCTPDKPYICKKVVYGHIYYFCSPNPCSQWHRP
jgi:hypothetical protein